MGNLIFTRIFKFFRFHSKHKVPAPQKYEGSLHRCFSELEKDQIQKIRPQERRHPLNRLMFGAERDLQVVINTERALSHILRINEPWFNVLKKRLMARDFAEASSALGELRAYGYLLEAGVPVKPPDLNRLAVQPEFWVEYQNQRVIIEVHSKQMNRDEAKALQKFKEERIDINNPKGYVRTHGVTPFGKPKLGENVTENVISKLAAIKGEEHQLSDSQTSIVWMDFQDEAWELIMEKDISLPVRSWNGAFNSGELWYAFYGWAGAPIFEGEGFSRISMRHAGRFRQPTRLDAVIVALPRTTIILENPYSQKPIPTWLWERLIEYLGFGSNILGPIGRGII